MLSPEVIRDYLIQVEGIPEEQIAIATGSQRDIDGVDLFQATCPIRHIITVQALNEGWDCAWAYVLCSVANIHSAKDIEQLLGRVLRMPNAQASRFEPLNRAYAHVTHGQFQSTAAQLRDALVTLGFDRSQATEADLLVYITAWVAHLEQRLGLTPLLVHKNRLPARLAECLNRRAEQAAQRGMRELLGSLDDPASPLTIAPEEVLVAFTPQTAYAPATPYRGRLFTKHLYPTVGEINQPEAEVAVVLDALPEVALWLRNLDRHPSSFRLPCPTHKSDWFYPDFLARLTDGRLLVLEYKGSHLEDLDQAKRQIGLAWQRAMKSQGLFLWIGDAPETAQGRSIAEQIRLGIG